MLLNILGDSLLVSCSEKHFWMSKVLELLIYM